MDTETTVPAGHDVSIQPTTKEAFTGIEWPDYLVIALYFVSVLAVGLFVSLKNLYLFQLNLMFFQFIFQIDRHCCI